MYLQVFTVFLSIQLILGGESSLKKKSDSNICTNSILNTAVVLIEKASSLSKKCDEENDASCVLDIARNLIKKAKNGDCSTKRTIRATDCEELLAAGFNKSGNYTIWPSSRVNEGKSVHVYCDMQTEGGGWTVIQRRGDFGSPKDYFYQGWSSYKSGFGDIHKDFWLGNDNIFTITNQKLYSVRFDLKALDGEKRYALYDTFWIEDEARNYTLHISNYSGNAGDSMDTHNSLQFSTKDVKNDEASTINCAKRYKGGWWYNKCFDCNLNGLYLHEKNTDNNGVSWFTFKGYEPLDTTEIKIRSRYFQKTF